MVEIGAGCKLSKPPLTISKRNQKKIFKRFYREEGRDENTFPGFGIGLIISAEIIKKHNGTIGVESEKGEGATFYLTIPNKSKKE